MRDVEWAVALLTALGCTHINTSRAARRGWVRASCPLAPWTHEDPDDSRPSLVFKLPRQEHEAGAPVLWQCDTCGRRGEAPELLHHLTWLSGRQPAEASRLLSRAPLDLLEQDARVPARAVRLPRRIIASPAFGALSPGAAIDPKTDTAEAEEAAVQDRRERRSLGGPTAGAAGARTGKARDDAPGKVPGDVLDRFPLLADESCPDSRQAVVWLHDHCRISLKAMRRFQLRLYTDAYMGHAGILFPLLTPVEGAGPPQARDMWVRLLHEDAFFRLTPKLAGSDRDYGGEAWFGRHLHEPGQPVVLVDGPLDALRLSSLGVKNVFAAMGSPGPEDMARIQARVVYLAFGRSARGRALTLAASRGVRARTLHLLDWSVVGLCSAQQVPDQGQFRRVFEARRSFVAPNAGAVSRLPAPEPDAPGARGPDGRP